MLDVSVQPTLFCPDLESVDLFSIRHFVTLGIPVATALDGPPVQAVKRGRAERHPACWRVGSRHELAVFRNSRRPLLATLDRPKSSSAPRTKSAY